VYGTWLYAGIGLGVSLAATLISGALLGDGAKKSSGLGTTATDRKLTLKSAVESRKLVYGEVMLSGPLALKTTTGSTKEYLHLVVPMAAHKAAAFLEVWFDDTLSTASRILNYNRVKTHSGSILQEADSDLVAEAPGWTTAHRGRGVAYVYARLKYDSTVWSNGVKNVKAVVRGKALYDPRLATVSIASTAAGAPAVIITATPHGLAVGDEIFILGHAHLAKYYTVLTAPASTMLTLASQTGGAAVSLEASSTGGEISRLRWSNNWALAVLDYLLWFDALNARLAEIDADYWIAAANVSDEQVALGSASLCTADAATDVVTLAEAVPWQTGLQVRLSSTGVLPGGLAAATSYAWVRLTPTTGYLASTKENALYGLGVNITSAGTGAHTISAALSCTVDATAGSVTLKDDVPRDDDAADDAEQDSISPQFGWATGDAVRFFQGTPPAGLSLGVTYYWIRLTNASGKLAASHEAAITGTALALADAGSGLTMARVSQPRYTANGVIDLSEKHADNLDRLRAAAGGVLPYVQGKYRLHASAATTPTFELTADDLRDTLKVQARPAKRELFNAVRGTFVDPTQLWEPSDLPAVVSEQYAAEDGEQIFKDVEHHFITDCIRGQRVNKIILEAGRQGMTVEFPARLTAGQHSSMSIAPWDVGALTIDQLGWEGKLFRCLAWKIADDQGIDLSLQEYAASAYDWDPSEAAHADTAPNTSLANPWDVAAPTGLVLTTGASIYTYGADGTISPRLLVSWAAPADEYVLSGGHIELQMRESGTATWAPAGSCSGSDTQYYLTQVQDGYEYDVRVRAINGMGAMSDWLQGSCLVLADPPAVALVENLSCAIGKAGVSVSFDLATAPWVSGYDVAVDDDLLARGFGESPYLVKPIVAGLHAVRVRARDLFGQRGPWAETEITVSAPAAPAVAAAIVGLGVKYDITPPTSDFAIAGYMVREGSDWATGLDIGAITGTTHTIAVGAAGTVRRWFAAVDTAGNVGTPTAIDVEALVPLAPTVTARISGSNIEVAWAHNLGSLPLASSEILHGATLETATSLGSGLTNTSLQVPGAAGLHRFWVRDTDSAGNPGPAGMVELVITAPGTVAITPQVIDNNVLLAWTEAAGTLPLADCEIRRGATYAESVPIGRINGRFSALFENAGGVYTYWITQRDTAGNDGTPAPITVQVSQPPDYVLHADMASAFGGTLTNALLDRGALVMPVDTVSTVAERMAAGGWASRQAKADAGYPYRLEPTLAGASYEEIIDYGTTLSGTKITVTQTSQIIHGSVALGCNIKTSPDAEDWTDLGDVWMAYGTAFRYAKITLTATPDGGSNDLLRLIELRVRLDVKLSNDAGMVYCNAADEGGTQVNFNVSFLDVRALVPGVASGGAGLYALYDFQDAPNPTGFKMLLFDSNGNRASGWVSWSAKGVLLWS